MDRLPEEIVANIISHLLVGYPSVYSNRRDPPPEPPLAPYATVSRRWQPHIESHTFTSITLTSERLASPLASQALTPDRVRRYVRFIRILVILPPYDVEPRTRPDTDDEKAANDAVLTDVVQKAFAFLSSMAPAASADGAVDASRTEFRSKIRLDLEVQFPGAGYETSSLNLRLPPGTPLPIIRCISFFHVSTVGRAFAPSALCLMASRIPGLEHVSWELADEERRDITRRRKLRADLAAGIQTLPSSLQSFQLSCERRTPMDHSFQNPSILNEQGQDELSLSLYTLSRRLVDFSVLAEVGPEIFGPSGGSTEPGNQEEQLRGSKVDSDDHGFSPPSWPLMQRYNIFPGPIAPSGKWRFLRDPNLSDEDEDEDDSWDEADDSRSPGNERDDTYRTEPDPDEVNFLFRALAHAAGQMPALEEIHLELHAPVGITSPEAWYWPDGYRPAANAAARKPKLAVLSEPVFHPAEEVIQAWREVAKKHRGEGSELEVIIKDGWYDM